MGSPTLLLLLSAATCFLASSASGQNITTVPTTSNTSKIRFTKDTAFTNRFFSTQAVNMVLPQPIRDFDIAAFRNSVKQHLTGVLVGESLNSDDASYDDGLQGYTRTPNTRAPSSSQTVDSPETAAARSAAVDALIGTFVLLEVCAFDISPTSASLASFYEWPRLVCDGYTSADGKTTTKNAGNENWAGTLVRFSFGPIVNGYGGYGEDGTGRIGALVPPSLAAPLQPHSLNIKGVLEDLNVQDALDRNYLTNALVWSRLIGQPAPSRADGDHYGRTAYPVVTAANFTSIAFRPTSGQLQGRPLATVAGWGASAAQHRPQSVAEIVGNNKGTTAAVVIFVIIFIILIILSCCFVWRLMCRKKEVVGVGGVGFGGDGPTSIQGGVGESTAADIRDGRGFSNISNPSAAATANNNNTYSPSERGGDAYSVPMRPIDIGETTNPNRESTNNFSPIVTATSLQGATAIADDALERANRLAGITTK